MPKEKMTILDSAIALNELFDKGLNLTRVSSCNGGMTEIETARRNLARHIPEWFPEFETYRRSHVYQEVNLKPAVRHLVTLAIPELNQMVDDSTLLNTIRGILGEEDS